MTTAETDARTVLVTGAGGFIARAVIAAIRRHARVIPVHHSFSEGGTAGDDTLAGPIEDREFVDSLPAADIFIHAAALVPSSGEGRTDDDFFKINEEGTVNLLRHAAGHGARQFIYLSTASVYRPSQEPLSETSLIEPLGAYASSKLAGESACRALAGEFERVFLLRLFHPYGPGQHSRQLVPRIVEAVREGRPIVVPASGRPRRTVTFVSDVARAVVDLAFSDSPDGLHVVNVGGPESPSIGEIAYRSGELLDLGATVEVVESQTDDLIADTSRLANLAGRVPDTSLAAGLDALISSMG